MVSGIRALGFAICAASVLWVGAARAGTILILNPAGDGGPDIGFNGTVLATLPDGNGATTGDQDTTIDFADFLSPLADVPTPTASFTLSGLAAVGSASVFGALAVQNFLGGSLAVYDPADALLIAGTLNSSALSGTIGPPGTGGLFTTTFATVTGGSLMPLIDVSTLTISMTLSDVSGGSGLRVVGGQLQGFEADSVVAIAANAPEPAIPWLLLVCAAALIGVRSRLRSIE
jgi:hypothetical protein